MLEEVPYPKRSQTRLSVRLILVEHVWRARLHLRFQDAEPPQIWEDRAHEICDSRCLAQWTELSGTMSRRDGEGPDVGLGLRLIT